MADKNITITITKDSTGKYCSDHPAQIDIDLDDTITFDATKAACCVCFNPKKHFGKRIKLSADIPHGPYSPSATGTLSYFMEDIGSTDCTPPQQHILSYSIKVG
jgi:hypothetical protein